jgi:hypothetical protein
MKALRLSAAVMSALLALAPATAQPPTIAPKFGPAPPPQRSIIVPNFGWPYYEREYVTHVIEHEVIREVPVEAPPPPPPRELYVIGRSYGSLPGGCMKMIEGGASYFYCSGEWYRAVGASRYEAVVSPL